MNMTWDMNAYECVMYACMHDMPCMIRMKAHHRNIGTQNKRMFHTPLAKCVSTTVGNVIAMHSQNKKTKLRFGKRTLFAITSNVCFIEHEIPQDTKTDLYCVTRTGRFSDHLLLLHWSRNWCTCCTASAKGVKLRNMYRLHSRQHSTYIYIYIYAFAAICRFFKRTSVRKRTQQKTCCS